ncbi:MAG: hypothetical protein WBG37_22065 [Desulfobacterales bacterium]
MPFIRQSGICGKIYVPEPSAKIGTKHPCRDCFACQMCSEDRCRICRDVARGSRCGKGGTVGFKSPVGCRTRNSS